jgi:caa(3)-type oxidase subunit IV
MTSMAARRHISGRAVLIAWIGLMVLTGLSLAVSYLDLGTAESFVAFGIAVFKGLVVVFVFMHLAEARFVNRMVMLVVVFFVVLLSLGMVGDVAERQMLPWPAHHRGAATTSTSPGDGAPAAAAPAAPEP